MSPRDVIGNDVVDLRDPESADTAIHPRFDRRVFTPAERRRLRRADAAGRHRLRWTLWAAKEAAWKAARQLDPALPFSPVRFEVQPGSATVRWKGGDLALLVDLDDDRVHVVASGTTVPGGIVHAAVADRDPDPGRSVRRLARRLLARGRTGPIGFGRERRVPFALAGGRRLPVSLSFSHHGRFVAVAVCGEDP